MQPANLNEPFCGLCLSSVRDTNCQKIDVMSDILEIVLPDVNLEQIDKHFVCEVCSVKLFAAFNFKTICINTEDIIFPHINASKKSPVDLKEVYLKEKGNIQLNISEDQRICRLCFQLITFGFVSLNEVDVDIIDTYIPQVNISATSHPVICGPCFDSLRTHGSFLGNCLDAQKKLKSNDKGPCIKTGEIEINLEDDCQNMQEKCNSVDKPFYIKSEEIEIKVEEDNENSSSYSYDNEIIENKQRYASEDIGAITSEQILKCESGFNENFTTSMSVHNIQIGNSEKPEFQKNDKFKYGTNNTQHGNPSKIQMYKCDVCDYTTKYSWTLQVHQCSVHKDSVEDQILMYYNSLGIQRWKCARCSYETKYKRYLRVHLLLHKDIQMYKCDTCTYETKFKTHLKKHQLRHKGHLEKQMHKCDTCGYEANCKSRLNSHQLLHKDPSEIKMYKCDVCDYMTKYEKCLKNHQLIHKDPSKVQMYKCDTCRFETKHKGHLNRHQLIHKDLL